MHAVSARVRRRRIRSGLILIGASAVVAPAIYLLLNTSFGDPAERARAISKEQGVAVEFGDPAAFRLSSNAEASVLPGEMRAERADLEHVSAALDGIERALASYPVGFVSKSVGAVFVCGTLHAGKSRAAGTRGSQWILIAAPEYRSIYETKDMSAATFHHELSSAVLEKTGALARWRAFWPTARAPVYNADEVLRPDDREPDPATGFRSAYATTNPENDFNVYAENLFMAPRDLQQLAKKYMLVRTKLQFVIDRYVEVDGRMATKLNEQGYEAAIAGN